MGCFKELLLKIMDRKGDCKQLTFVIYSLTEAQTLMQTCPG